MWTLGITENKFCNFFRFPEKFIEHIYFSVCCELPVSNILAFKLCHKSTIKAIPLIKTDVSYRLIFKVSSNLFNMKFFAVFAAVIAVVSGQWAQYELGSSYGSPAPSYSAPSYSAPAYKAPSYSAPSYSAPSYSAPAYHAPSYTAKPSYAPSYAGPATSYTYPSPAPPGKKK